HLGNQARVRQLRHLIWVPIRSRWFFVVYLRQPQVDPRSPRSGAGRRAGEGHAEKERPMRSLRFLRNLTLIALLGAPPLASHAQFSIGVSINIAPPELPGSEQPLCPAPNYIWNPG